jgi:hypothetical protein
LHRYFERALDGGLVSLGIGGLLLLGIAPAGRRQPIRNGPGGSTDITDLVGRTDIAERLIVDNFPDFRLSFPVIPAHRESPLGMGIFRLYCR